MDKNERAKLKQELLAVIEGQVKPADLIQGRGYWMVEQTKGIFRDEGTGITYTWEEIEALDTDNNRRFRIRQAFNKDALIEPFIVQHLPPAEFVERVTIEINPIEVIEQPEVIEEIIGSQTIEQSGTEHESKTDTKSKPKKKSKTSKRKRYDAEQSMKDLERAEKMNELKDLNNLNEFRDFRITL